MTHRHELRGQGLWVRECAGQRGIKGRKWENCNSIINKIYIFKKVMFAMRTLRGVFFLFLMFKLVLVISSLIIIHNVVYDFNCVYRTGVYKQMCRENQHWLVLPASQCKQRKADQHIKIVPLSSLPLPALFMFTAGHGLGTHFTRGKSSRCQASPSSSHSQDSAANYNAPLLVFEGVY